ncbi:hypothetical protein AZE42_05010 [Rhizopogon vesiculosus]|uniref:Uncharacterized protein n=1 Tax=Rhizopogon vesiculosus TaxID=180088 RepID=A0A1J8QEV3_9AGAM|nr:hypothetical protein AZE42_05010 [Rhizopogon vesiculosus]
MVKKKLTLANMIARNTFAMVSITDWTYSGISRYKTWINSPASSSRAHTRSIEDYQPLIPSDSSLETEEEINMVLSSPKVIPSVTTRLPLSYASPWAFVESLYARFLTLEHVSYLFFGYDNGVGAPQLGASEHSDVFHIFVTLYYLHSLYHSPIRYKRLGKVDFLFAAADVQGNFLAVKAYGYTDLLSCMLLDAWSIPVCLFICWMYMRTRYHWTQILGVVICIGGLGILVASDVLSGRDEHAENRGKGDAFILVAATIFGIVNATEEFFVRHSPLYEVVGQIGMWGVLVNGIQALSLERRDVVLASWNGTTIGLLAGYTASIFIVYSLAPLLFRMASSSYFNIALLTSDFYGLLFGLLHFHYTPFWSYFPAFAVVILGLVIYFCHATPEEQGEWNVQIPTYVMKATQGGDENANADQIVTSFSDHERYERPDEFS